MILTRYKRSGPGLLKFRFPMADFLTNDFQVIVSEFLIRLQVVSFSPFIPRFQKDHALFGITGLN